MIIQNLLVASDFSTYSSIAERRAALLYKTYQCKKAEMITVEKPEAPEILALIRKSTADEAQASIVVETLQKLKIRANDLRDNFQVDFDCIVRFGQPAHEIISHSDEMNADLLIVGAHGGNFFNDLFVGNTVDKLMRMTRRPLLVVKRDSVSEYRHILVPVDFTEESEQAARLALAMHPKGLVTLLHAYEVWYEGRMNYASVDQSTIDFHRKQAHESARQSMNILIDKLDAPSRIIKRQIELDMPSTAIRKYADKFQPDLIVMGKHGYSRMEELLIGSVTRDTIGQTQCDILVVPSMTSPKGS